MTQTNGNGTSTEYAYNNNDPMYFLSSITHKRGTNILATIGYPTRDKAGNPRSINDWTGVWTYDYDANNRLTGATPPQPVPDQPAGGPYGYDWVRNRLNPPTGTNHMVYNAADQLTAWPGMHQYTYYGDGSLQEERNADGSQTMKSYAYTADGLLKEAEFDSTSPTVRRYLDNTWDADKNRVSYESGVKVDNTLTPQYSHTLVYDTTAGIPAVVKEDDVYCVREPGGELLTRVDGSNTSYYHFDQLGSTGLLTDASGNVTDRHDYDAYGALIAHEHYGNQPTDQQPYQYVGQSGYYTCWQEPRFGLLQLGMRFYEQDASRFTQRDRLGLTFDVSRYADAQPTVETDPSGLMGSPIQWVGEHPDCCDRTIAPSAPDPPSSEVFRMTRPREPDVPGLWKCMDKRRDRVRDHPLDPHVQHNCWAQLGRCHTIQWLKSHPNAWPNMNRCWCEDLLVCWKRLRPRSTQSSQLFLDWQAFCRFGQRKPYDPVDLQHGDDY